VIDRPAPTVWIVDNDLGFVCWLGELITEAGYLALPALRCREAALLMKKLGLPADVLFVNPHLKGVPRLLQTVRRANRQVKIVAIQSPSIVPPVAVNADATLQRPSEPISRLDWLRKVNTLLKNMEARM
jgi:two-component SAPR family response regulator